jgi:hypothetical protein
VIIDCGIASFDWADALDKANALKSAAASSDFIFMVIFLSMFFGWVTCLTGSISPRCDVIVKKDSRGLWRRKLADQSLSDIV